MHNKHGTWFCFASADERCYVLMLVWCAMRNQMTWWHDEYVGNRVWAESSQRTPAVACLAGIFQSQPCSPREGDSGCDPIVYGTDPKTQSGSCPWQDAVNALLSGCQRLYCGCAAESGCQWLCSYHLTWNSKTWLCYQTNQQEQLIISQKRHSHPEGENIVSWQTHLPG